jgi:hypothetical protein
MFNLRWGKLVGIVDADHERPEAVSDFKEQYPEVST